MMAVDPAHTAPVASLTESGQIEEALETGPAMPEGLLSGLAHRMALVAVICILLIAFSVTADVVLRNVFGTSLYGLNEITVLLVAVGVSACLPYGISHGAALTIELLSSKLSERARARFEALSLLLVTIFFGLLCWQVWETATGFAETDTTTLMTNLPKAPFFYAMSVAFGLVAVMEAIRTARAAQALVQADSAVGAVGVAVVAAIVAHGLAALVGLVPGGVYAAFVPASPLVLSAVFFAVLWILVLVGLPVGVGMGLTGILGTAAILGPSISLKVLGSETTSFITQDSLSVLPLFLLMGAFASVAGIGRDLYALSHALIGHVRGGLAHASILACAAFGTMTGSSIATQMSIGRIAMAEMRARNYSPEIAAGSIAAGGTLGQLLPPASALILFAVMTEQSVGKLFIGAILPGLIACLLYMATVAIWLRFFPGHAEPGPRSSLQEIALAARGAWSVILLLTLVMGGIYLGFFTDLEAGAIGATGAFLVALARGRLNPGAFWETIGGTTRSLAMIYSLIFGATMLSFFFGVSGLPQAFVDWVTGFGLPPLGVVLVLIAAYLVLGTAMDSFAMMVITVPIFVPLVVSLGFDPIWWGIITVICMEAGQISPPFGLNIFVIKALDPKIELSAVFRGCWPFFFSTLVKIALLVAIPALVTWLPSHM